MAAGLKTSLTISHSNTQAFAAERWATANQLYSLSKPDRALIDNVTTPRAFDAYIRETASNASSVPEQFSLQSISQIYRSLWLFESLVKEAVEPEHIDTSSMWAMVYLNVKVRLHPI